MKIEKIILNEERNASLTAYLLGVKGDYGHIAKRPGIVVIPGGGYQNCDDREADPIAMCYAKAGYQTFVLRYSIKENSVWPNPLNDYNQAMKVIQEHSEEWNLYADKIAVVGFSAGGHLAASAATMGDIRPAAAILGYAVLNEDVKKCNPSAPDLIREVDSSTPSCFLFATRNDSMVPVINSIQFMEALTKKGIVFESHIYAYGPHGFSSGDSSIIDPMQKMCKRTSNWVNDSIEFLKDVMGDFSAEGMTEPVCGQFISEDYAKFLSAECTIRKVMTDPEAAIVVKEIIQKIFDAITKADKFAGSDKSVLWNMVETLKVREFMQMGQISPEIIGEIDSKLRKVPNNRI